MIPGTHASQGPLGIYPFSIPLTLHVEMKIEQHRTMLYVCGMAAVEKISPENPLPTKMLFAVTTYTTK